jgi:hypothetical protein
VTQVDLAELRHDQKQPVILLQLGDVLLETKLLDDIPSPFGEPLDVVGEVRSDVVRVLETQPKSSGAGTGLGKVSTLAG